MERSSLKLYPVVKEVCKRLAGQEPEKSVEPKPDSAIQSQDEDEDMEPDMRSVLGFLN